MMSKFEFESMTPELMAYLGQRGHPGYEYPKNDKGQTICATPTPESAAAVDTWRAEGVELKTKLQPGEADAYYKAQKLWFCRDESKTGDTKNLVSPSGKYRLVVTRHSTGKGTWSYSKGKVFIGDTLIETVCRNYSAFPYAWVEGHKTGHDYLVCGEDYQGQTVINLVTGNRVDHLPSSAEKGHGFCWSNIEPNADGTLLAVSGCYWACPYEMIIVDFSDPMSPPWEIVGRDSEDEFDGWTGPESCRIGTRYEVVDLPGHEFNGKKEHECSVKDLEAIEAYVDEHKIPDPDGGEAGWKVVVEAHDWSRGEGVVEAG